MGKIDHLLREYSLDVISQGISVFDMTKLMADKGVGALLVLEAGKLVGVTREGDYVRMVNLTRRPVQEAQIRELIDQNVIYMPLEQIVERCLELTQEKQIRHLPIIADGYLIGIISMGNLASAVILGQEDQI